MARLLCRSCWLAVELTSIAVRFFLLSLCTLGRPSIRQRTECLHWGCRRALRVFVRDVTVTGEIPRSGLLVSNHLSYLDIPLIGSLGPTIFVSKADVRQWPVFGWFAGQGATVFVQRERRSVVGDIANEIGGLLDQGQLVALFPEGTSSGGETVLPFKSSLLQPVVGRTHNVHVASIAYQVEEGNASEDICYWGDMTFGPHVLKLLSRPRARARLDFAAIAAPAPDRKALANQLHTAVLGLHSGGRGSTAAPKPALASETR